MDTRPNQNARHSALFVYMTVAYCLLLGVSQPSFFDTPCRNSLRTRGKLNVEYHHGGVHLTTVSIPGVRCLREMKACTNKRSRNSINMKINKIAPKPSGRANLKWITWPM